jgi:hypothetical protein
MMTTCSSKPYILLDEVLKYISTDEKITDILINPLFKMKSLCT